MTRDVVKVAVSRYSSPPSGRPGSGSGEFAGISGLAISASGTIYTSETGGDRVQVFTPAQAGAVREVYAT
jgi:hypothetical protein